MFVRIFFVRAFVCVKEIERERKRLSGGRERDKRERGKNERNRDGQVTSGDTDNDGTTLTVSQRHGTFVAYVILSQVDLLQAPVRQKGRC